jgi:hypothetical protein
MKKTSQGTGRNDVQHVFTTTINRPANEIGECGQRPLEISPDELKLWVCSGDGFCLNRSRLFFSLCFAFRRLRMAMDVLKWSEFLQGENR